MSATGTAEAGVATSVSYPGGTAGTAGGGSAAPGAQGVGATLSPSQALLWIIGGSAVALIAIGVVFRRPIGES
jgi:hypothetical protein